MRDLAEVLRSHSASIEELLERETPKGRDDHLSDLIWYQFSSGGKRLRPGLCLMTCEALGGDPKQALPFALASEVLHNFFLIHDDIEDGDTMRRDQPTLWVKYGVPNAINAGDYLIAVGYRLILAGALDAETNLRLARAYTLAFERTVEGQALDINLRAAPEVDLETYYRIVTLKTGYYLALTWVGGAIVAGVADGELDGFWELGRRLGPAFQIRDDVIDLTHGKGRGGEVGCDIREGKPSVLFAYTVGRRASSDADLERLVEVFRKPREETTDGDIEWVIALFRANGALDFAQSEAERLVAEAGTILDELPLGDEGRRRFRDVAQFVIDRTI